MKREIKFKAKRVSDGKWVFGDLMHYNGLCYITPHSYSSKNIDDFEVKPETVCQLIKTVDGVEIYENDKLKGDDDLCVYCLIEWDETNGRYQINDYGYEISCGEGNHEVISNEVSLVDENIYNIEDIDIKDIIGNIND